MSEQEYTTAEVWKPIPGLEFYEASNTGLIRRIAYARRSSRGREAIRRSKILGQSTNGSGYRYFKAWVGSDSPRNVYVHRAVLSAFVGPPAIGNCTCHNDGDPSNNRIDNLRWDTQKSNMADRVTHGTAMRGTQYPKAKLTEESVKKIRNLIEGGESLMDTAKQFDVSKKLILNIKHRKAWGWVP